MARGSGPIEPQFQPRLDGGCVTREAMLAVDRRCPVQRACVARTSALGVKGGKSREAAVWTTASGNRRMPSARTLKDGFAAFLHEFGDRS